MSVGIKHRFIGRLRPRSLKEPVVYYFSGIYNRASEHHIFLWAAGLSFSLFTCIIPLILIVFAVVGSLFEKTTLAAEISSAIDRVIPYKEVATFVKDLALTRVEEFRIHKNIAGLLGFVGLLFAASGLFSSMRTILNSVYSVRSTSPAIVGKLRDLGLVVLVLLYFLLSTTIIPVLGIVEDFADKSSFLQIFNLSYIEDLAWGVVSFLIILSAFYTIYYLVPQVKMSKRVVGLSALSATLLWVLAEQLFGLYIAHAATLKRVYGAFTLLIVVALWIYYTSICFILGAEIGQLYLERRRKKEIFDQAGLA